MLYEPPKTKRYILIGATAIVLAVLVIVAVPLIYRNKAIKTPVAKLSSQEKLQQAKIQKEQDRLIEMTNKQNDVVLSAEQIQNDQNKLIEETKSSGTSKSPEEIQKDQNNLISATKK